VFFAGCVAVGVVAGSIFGGQNPVGPSACPFPRRPLSDWQEGKVHGGTQYRESGVERA
jgi:hypothetical protein